MVFLRELVRPVRLPSWLVTLIIANWIYSIVSLLHESVLATVITIAVGLLVIWPLISLISRRFSPDDQRREAQELADITSQPQLGFFRMMWRSLGVMRWPFFFAAFLVFNLVLNVGFLVYDIVT